MSRRFPIAALAFSVFSLWTAGVSFAALGMGGFGAPATPPKDPNFRLRSADLSVGSRALFTGGHVTATIDPNLPFSATFEPREPNLAPPVGAPPLPSNFYTTPREFPNTLTGTGNSFNPISVVSSPVGVESLWEVINPQPSDNFVMFRFCFRVPDTVLGLTTDPNEGIQHVAHISASAFFSDAATEFGEFDVFTSIPEPAALLLAAAALGGLALRRR